MSIPVFIYEHGSNNKCVFSYETRRDVDLTSRISPRSNSSTKTGIRIQERGGEERYFDWGTKMAPSRGIEGEKRKETEESPVFDRGGGRGRKCSTSAAHFRF